MAIVQQAWQVIMFTLKTFNIREWNTKENATKVMGLYLSCMIKTKPDEIA